MTHVIKLLALVSEQFTEHDGRFVVEFIPPSMDPSGQYRTDGRLITTDDLQEAKRFDDAKEAFDYYTQANGRRPDGRPNKPLTAWTVEITDIKRHMS